MEKITVDFWGVRGSVPSPGKKTAKYEGKRPYSNGYDRSRPITSEAVYCNGINNTRF